MTTNTQNTDQQRQAVTWACLTIKQHGGTLYAGPGHNCWDIETPNGWRAAYSVNQICDLAREMQRAAENA